MLKYAFKILHETEQSIQNNNMIDKSHTLVSNYQKRNQRTI